MQRNKRQPVGIHAGTESIVMIFAVLCLTVFSALSFVTANQERVLAEKAAIAVQQYFEADWQCEVIYQQIWEGLQDGKTIEQLQQQLRLAVTMQEDGWQVDYAVDVDEAQRLQVRLFVLPEGEIRTEQWCVVNREAWQYEDTIAVWDGNERG